MDKQTYWKNRKAGKRGQGEYPKLVAMSYGFTPKPVSKKALLKNTKRARKAAANG